MKLFFGLMAAVPVLAAFTPTASDGCGLRAILAAPWRAWRWQPVPMERTSPAYASGEAAADGRRRLPTAPRLASAVRRYKRRRPARRPRFQSDDGARGRHCWTGRRIRETC